MSEMFEKFCNIIWISIPLHYPLMILMMSEQKEGFYKLIES